MSLHGSYDEQNIFAKILRGEAPCVKVYEDEHVLAFMDIFPQSQGHTLVVPKDAARNLLDVSDETAKAAIVRVKKIARAVATALKPDGVTVTQFNGASAGQSVFHIHFHIIPCWKNQDIAGHGATGQADMEDLKALSEQIIAAL